MVGRVAAGRAEFMQAIVADIYAQAFLAFVEASQMIVAERGLNIRMARWTSEYVQYCSVQRVGVSQPVLGA
ncbi:MAG TPA: hypothetical protein VL614_01305 [Acetobacteraceae bacterium]|jgi:hypothetical protein|nr:hypothetical protein [Acetobacteraceae bacterium]